MANSNVANAGLNQMQVFNATMPREGGRAVPFTLNFAAATQFTVDFTLAMSQNRISQVQCVFVDNSGSSVVTVLTVNSQGQPVETIKIPAYAQGTFPLLAPHNPVFTVANATSAVVGVTFINVPLPSAVWYPGGSATLAALAPAVTSIAVGGTAVSPFVNQTFRGGGFIANPISATESLFIDLTFVAGVAAPGVNGTTTELVAGQSFTIPPGFSGSVSLNAATGGHTFTASGYN
jgi:hypothetical protein